VASERRILAEGLIGVTAEPDVFAWRNNTGQGWQGQRLTLPNGYSLTIKPGMVVLRDARPISFGLPGSGDILGVARAGDLGFGFALEAKTEDRRSQQSEQQRKFQIAFERAGGRYGVFRSPEEAVAHLRGWRGDYS
jgi:hypothetical protein